MRSLTLAPLFALAIATGCGGDDGPTSSGVAPTTPIAALTQAESTSLCEFIVEEQGGAGHVEECGDGFTITTETVAECMSGLVGASCTATVADFEACFNAVENSCQTLAEPSCEAYFDCFSPI
jgi:hypothetical protein